MYTHRVRIAFIDDGIHPCVIAQGVLSEHYAADENGVRPCAPAEALTHGTACYEIFRNHMTVPHRITSIKVLDDATGRGNHKAVVAALKWSKEFDFEIINLSLGTQQYLDFAPIAAQIKRLRKTIIVAACSNQNRLTFPACLPQVIGVRHSGDTRLKGTFAYLPKPYDQIDVLVTSEGANSYAAPIISARICTYIFEGIVSPLEIRKKLAADALQDISFIDMQFYKNLMPDWEEVDIPIVGWTDASPKATKVLADVIKLMVAEEYRAIGLTRRNKTKAESLIFRLPAIQWIETLYNFTLPDILFLQIDREELLTLPEAEKPQIIFEAQDMHSGAEKIFNKLMEHYN
ncbi:MAG: hypothetical protein FWC16_09340 [Defluviitaleaceae bacterium]|nr:hypothetical protein [Defluviitaleaceae bacterium]MCL2275115.1 hypothetical protein [Defluviitaleaceae bacterium]